MRKSLSMLLAIAMIFSMFSSLAFAADAPTAPATAQEKYDALAALKIFQGINDAGDAGLDQPMDRAQFARVAALIYGLDGIGETDTREVTVKPFSDVELGLWYTEEIDAVKAAKYFEGNADGTFNPSGKITVQETAIVLVKVLGLEIDKDALVEGSASWAGPYIQAILDAKIPFPTNYKEDAIRSDLATLAYTAYVAVEAAKVPVVTTATKVASVSATNLKEVDVTFDGTVDKSSAENKNAYTVKKDGTTVVVSSASLLEDGKTVRLSLSGLLTNQAEHTIAINGVKDSSKAVTITATDEKFTPVEAIAPTVVSVNSLGNKAFKITFSEPVQLTGTVAGALKVDDKVVSGLATISGRTVTVQLFNVLTDGAHVLNINNNFSDYANIQLVTTTKNFDVVADTTAPTIAEVKDATLDGVTIVFSEDVQDLEALATANYYWISTGTTKLTATSVTKVDGKTFALSFSGNRLPGYATDLNVQNVKDYSGNVIAAGTKVSVTAVIDQTRPEILTSIFNTTSNSSVTMTFTKAIDPTSFNSSNVSIVDKDSKIVANGYSATWTDSKTLVINFTSALGAGTYTLTVNGLKDTTLLQNVILPYTQALTVSDISAPTAGATVTGTLPTYIVTFSKAMEVGTSYSILNTDNYYITYNTATLTGVTGKLPAGTNLSPINGNKGVIITLPSSVTAVTQLVVQGVKDTAGNFITGYSKTYNNPANFQAALAVVAAKATGSKTVQVKFNQPMNQVVPASFTITGGPAVSTATVDTTDSSVVNLGLATVLTSNVAGVSLATTGATLTNGVTGAVVTTATGIAISDAIAPSIIKVNDKITIGAGGTDGITTTLVAASTTVIAVNFDEAVLPVNSSLLGTNFTVFRSDGIQLTNGLDYLVTHLANKVTITLVTSSANDKLKGYYGTLRVVFNNSNANIKDVTGSTDFDGTTVIKSNANGFDTASDFAASNSIVVDNQGAAQPTLATATVLAGATVTITAVPAGEAAWLAPAGTTVFAPSATMTTAVAATTSILAPATVGTYKLFLVDAVGNISTASANTLTVSTSATAPASVTLTAGTTPVGGVTNVAIPTPGTTDITGAVTGWITTTADEIKFTVTDAGAATSTITIGGAAYVSGNDYTIAATGSLTIVVTTTEAGKVTAVRTFTVAVS